MTTSFFIKVDTKEFERRIAKLEGEFPNIGKKMMRAVFYKMRNDIKRNIRNNFIRRKGWLLKDVNYWAFPDLAGAIFTRNSKRQGAHYASVLENGALIKAKKGKYLYIFYGKDEKGKTVLKKVPSVFVPPRPFFWPVVDEYWGGIGAKARDIMDKALQQEIDEHVEKKGRGAPDLKAGD
jgi:hypothetical protein